MKKFKTLTELEILRLALETVSRRWDKECAILETNSENKIAKARRDIYWEKVEELRKEIIRLENK